MGARGRELVAADEPAVVAKPSLDLTTVENSQGDRGLPNAAGADENDWTKLLDEINCPLD